MLFKIKGEKVHLCMVTNIIVINNPLHGYMLSLDIFRTFQIDDKHISFTFSSFIEFVINVKLSIDTRGWGKRLANE